MGRKKVLTIVSGVVGGMILVSALVTCVMVGLASFDGMTRLTTNEETALDRDGEVARMGVDPAAFRAAYQIEEISVPSTRDNRLIPADYISPDGNRDRATAVLVHGLGGNRLSVYHIAELFLELGYNVLAYDQRASGENTAQRNTFGYLESYDLLDCVAYVDGLLGAKKPLVVWGTSFGGATTATALGRDDSKIDAAFLDSPLSEARYLIENQLKLVEQERGTPAAFTMFTGNLALKLRLGFGVDDANAVKWIKNATTPVLIFHSRTDTVTPFWMGQALYDAIPGKEKQLAVYSNSPHSMIYENNRENYRDNIQAFLEKYTRP